MNTLVNYSNNNHTLKPTYDELETIRMLLWDALIRIYSRSSESLFRPDLQKKQQPVVTD